MASLGLPLVGQGAKRLFALLLSLLALTVPALAAGGENVRLQLTGSDYIYLYVSLFFGVLALGAGFYIRAKVLAESTGTDSMKEVGAAIMDGAMAYLQQQIRTMGIFVAGIFVLLMGLYYGQYGVVTAISISVCFVLGVLASYIAGYVGMNMAVNANMRTAFAALSSYKLALEVAFRAGAVAGLITVGMGLLGATLIFLADAYLSGGANATKLLVGFGFGGSLAALFMRVGGGIYTKAADVGADLVGKVEAGIPEDDPRNPAVIADNVGDNVGDCAGMAADVFESYEVTLVAAIVLGAATAAIFDTATWTRLILFALMARGLGIVASMFGIWMVKGSEDINVDPLKPIKKGFSASAYMAIGLTALLAFWMMGGTDGKFGGGTIIRTNQLKSQMQVSNDYAKIVVAAKYKIAAQKKIDPSFVSEEDVMKEPSVRFIITEMERKEKLRTQGEPKGADEKTLTPEELKEKQDEQLRPIIQSSMQAKAEDLEREIKMDGYRQVDLNDKEGDFKKWTVASQPNIVATPGMPSTNQAVDTWFKDSDFTVYQLEVAQKTGPMQGQKETAWLGPTPRKQLDDQLKQFENNPTFTVTKKKEHKVVLFSDPKRGLLLGIDDQDGTIDASRIFPGAQGFIFKATQKELDDLAKKKTDEEAALNAKRTDLLAKRDAADKAKNTDETAKLDREISQLRPTQPNPNPEPLAFALVQHATVYWWQFVLCIAFGILMAFAFEFLTDYYVSLHKRPVREVAEVSTAGPAPMIITGFAYGKESAVFSVFAIVACLIAPLLIFNPGVYGGYLLSFYGIALVGLGLLTTTAYILAMDTFGPISDNAQGVFEMSGAGHDSPEGARRVQLLDAAGNTTKALTKGFAIATAVVAAVALFHAFVEEGKLTTIGMRLEVPEIFLGLLLGGAAPYLFSAFSINAVGRASFQLIEEVRSQFRNDPGIMLGTSKPNYARCVAIVTAAAQKELLGPGILAIAFPLLVAFGFSIGKAPTMIDGQPYNLVGAQALGGFLAGAIVSGQLLAVMLANSGGLWDNVKKLIEDGMHGGKGTEAHKAAVVCDTVGDPFKDTAGPAMNPLIKVMNLVALLIAPQVIRPMDTWVTVTVTAIAAGALLYAIIQSKKGSLGESLKSASAGETSA